MNFTHAQLAERRTYVGASEVAAALGLSLYNSRLELYMRKTTDEPSQETPPMRFGKMLESHVLDEFQRRVAPHVVERPTDMNPLEMSRGVISCHLDGRILEVAVVEAKTARNRDGWGYPSEGADALPADYLFQVTAQMELTGYRLAYVPVLFRDSLDLEVYESTYDAELAELIVEGVQEFWSFVERREPPPPDWSSPAALEVVKKVFKGTDGTILQAGPDEELYYRALCDAQERAANYGRLADSAKAHLLWSLGNGAEIRFPDGKALRRKLVSKKGYVVEPSSYIDARIIGTKE